MYLVKHDNLTDHVHKMYWSVNGNGSQLTETVKLNTRYTAVNMSNNVINQSNQIFWAGLLCLIY